MSFTTRNFGVEIELYGLTRTKAESALRAAGVTLFGTDGWVIKTDSSIQGVNGREIVSPVLSGTEALETVRKVVRELNNRGAKVNNSCGLHVHVDARDLDVTEIKSVVTRYADHEVEIDAFIKATRRQNQGIYCQSVRAQLERSAIRERFDTAGTIGALARVYGRYSKVNLESLVRHGSIEFRQHHATMDSAKVINWITFCVNFVEMSRPQSVATLRRNAPRTASTPRRSTGRRNARRYELPEGMARMVNALENWCTIEHLASVSGMSESSVRVRLTHLRNQFGYRIQRRRYSGYRIIGRADNWQAVYDAYQARQAEQRAARAQGRSTRTRTGVRSNVAGVELAGVFTGLDPEITTYYRERSEEMA